MGYLEKVMGDNEQVVYSTHQHVIVLLSRIIGSLFVFVVFLAVSLAVLTPGEGEAGDQVRFIIGLIALGSLVMPLYLIVSAWIGGLRGREFAWRVWRATLAGLLILAFALLLMLAPGFKVIGFIALVVTVVPLFEIVRTFLDWWNERYIITNRRVMEVKGTINKNVRDSALEKVNDVDLTQSVVGRMLRYGTVQIITGSDIGVNNFRRISNPVRFKREMLNAKEGIHPSKSVTESEKAPSAEPANADILDVIAELDEMRQQGILTEDEFQAKKTDLLERL